ncbi:MAG: glycosyltransferase family 4 protein [Pigmentiphaga sp.]|nr:glycosyltransferase family 4 protein [Pigmentiphaga sp.]
MKILYTNFHRGDGGGHTTYILSLARNLSDQHEIVVAAPEGSRLMSILTSHASVKAIPHDFKGGLFKTLVKVRVLRSVLRHELFDIIHVNGATDHRACMLALIGVRAQRPAIIYTQHSARVATSVGAFVRAKLATDHVICVCDYTRRQMLYSFFGGKRLHLVRNGVDVNKFIPPSQMARSIAKQSWVPAPLAGRLVIGSNAGTAAYKNWLDMLEAISLLPAILQRQVVVLIAGMLPSPVQLAKVDALGLSNTVIFSGLLSDVRPFLAAIDVGFVVSSSIETISFACREMMAMGVPVIVSDVGGLPENVDSGLDGWVVPARDPPAIAAVLKEILDSPGCLISMGLRARKKAIREFSIDSCVASTERVYELATSNQVLQSKRCR